MLWRVADAPTKLALIRAGLGWGHLPVAMVQDDLARGVLRRLELEHADPEPLRVPLWAIAVAGAPLGPAGQWLLAELATRRERCLVEGP
ncbi:MAG TPA: LysR substrate-binding domain-containing protein [Kofleriaceae bacterium]|nr:LysR substrate-binding domain-containing protein [Kofleriaceae bacterium]